MEDELQKLGLSLYESRVINALSKDKLSLLELSKKSNVPFGKIYSIIKRLKEKEFIKETNTRPKLVYIENISEIISKLIKDKQKRELTTYEKLREISTEIEKNKGKMTIFFQIGTTFEDNKTIQLRTFKEAEHEILQIINIYHKPNSNRNAKTLWEKEIVNCIHRGVVIKSIYPRNTKLPTILEKLNRKFPDKFQIKKMDTDFTRCDLIDDRKIMIKFVRQDPIQFGGILFIEDEKLNENLRKIFYMMWDED